MYKFRYLLVCSLLLNLVLLSMLIIMSLNSVSSFNDYFNPDLSVTSNALVKEEFKYSPKQDIYVKSSGDTSFFYNPIYGKDSKIYRRSIRIRGATDSLEIAQWVRRNKAFICSAWVKSNGGKYFFVKGISSGLISKCRVDGWGLVVFLDYPYEGENLDELQKLREY